MQKKLCKKCGGEMPPDCTDKLCRECRNRRRRFTKRLCLAATAVGSAVAAFLLLMTERGSAGDADETAARGREAAAVPRPRSAYKGRVPPGCAACGGPYPLCRDGCAAFDD